MLQDLSVLKTVIVPPDYPIPWSDSYLVEVKFLYEFKYHKTRYIICPSVSTKQIMYFLKKFYMKDFRDVYREVEINVLHKIQKESAQLSLF